MRFFTESLSVVCVNVFVLLSGWFGITASKKGVLNFIFQTLFFSLGIYGISLLVGSSQLRPRGIAECFVLTQWNWFILSYLCLYILSPVLNAFVCVAESQMIRNVLIYFFLFQTLYSWLSGAALFFADGFSVISFIGLYLLARYVRLNPLPIFTKSNKIDLCIYLITAFLGALFAFLLTEAELDNRIAEFVVGRLYTYTSPLVIVGSLYLLLFFSKLKTRQSSFVNKVALSSFAVYLMHINANTYESFQNVVKWIYHNHSAFVFVMYAFVFQCLLFVAAVLIDRLRLILWRKIWSIYAKRTCR